MRVVENVPLSTMTTLALGGPARRVVTAESEDELVEAVGEVDASGQELLVVGGGSNLVVGDAGFGGSVVHVASRGRQVTARSAESVVVSVAAGEPWDDLVTWAASEGLSGVECLAGIPGLVGAVPMQNVGAYGQDVGETIVSVRVWDREARVRVDVPRAACGFAYRSSVFRGSTSRVVLGVTFELRRSPLSGELRYAELTRALGVATGARAPLETVRSTVVALRRGKGMVLDPEDADTRSAGSFFTNPVLDPPSLAALTERVAAVLGPEVVMPTFADEGGRTKVSAAWLIERAGFVKGYARGRVALSTKHALALTNRGGATTEELLVLARTIRDGVRERFGVTLENEPVMVGVAL